MSTEDVEIGTELVGFDPDSGEQQVARVTKGIESKAIDLVQAYVKNELIVRTSEHPFLVSEAGRVTASNITVGTLPVTSNGIVHKANRVGAQHTESLVYVYRLSVTDHQTYCFKKHGTAVHNK